MTRRISKFSSGLFLVASAHPIILAPILALVLSASATGQMVTGTFRWTDAQGVTHPLRRHLVDVFSDPPSPPGHLARVYTGLDGTYTATYFLPPGVDHTIFAHAYADTGINPAGGGGFVFTPGMPPGPLPTRPPPMTYADPPRQGIYHWGSGVAPNGGIVNYTFSPTPTASPPDPPGPDTTNRAMSVSDALFTGWYYSSQVRTAGAAELPVNFPVPGTASFYCRVVSPNCPRVREMHVLNLDAFDWDVILHEYGHYLAHIDEMDSREGIPLTPAGTAHSFGVSNINAAHGGKLGGVRIAWSEGLATYLGIAAQHVNPAAHNLPGSMSNPMMANVGDTRYTDIEDQSFYIDLESLDANGANDRGQGEGDELPIARILWDLADGTGGSETYDRLTLGHAGLYDDLNNDIPGFDNMPGLDRIEEVWDYYFAGNNDRDRTDYGAIFEEHGISPHPVGNSPINVTLMPSAPPPTFDWQRRNNDANDFFQLIVFDGTFSQRLLDIAITGDVTTYTLTNSEWNTLRNRAGAFNFVIAGVDTTTFTTGTYWSDAYAFSVIPEPGTVTLASCALVLGLLHRRRSILMFSAQ